LTNLDVSHILRLKGSQSCWLSWG